MEFWPVFVALPRIPNDLYRPMVVIRAFSYDPPLILTYTIYCTAYSKAIGGMLQVILCRCCPSLIFFSR